MKIFLDFDDTLFDTTRTPGKFWEDLVAIMKNGGWGDDEIEEIAESFSGSAFDKGKLYHYRSHLELLEEKYPRGKLDETLLHVEAFMKNLGKYLFPDVLPFLQKIPKEDILIITYGDRDFQRAKIEGSGIQHFVSEVLVTEGEKIEMIEEWMTEKSWLSHQSWFIDDKPRYFSQPSKKCMLQTVLMKRGEHVESNADTNFVVKDCYELLALIQQEMSDYFFE